MFTHLHLHTEYSMIDGLSRIPSLVQRAKEMSMTALALTDHGGMHGAVEFYSACKEADIKPILGCELYIALESCHSKGPAEKSPYHLTVLAKDNTGYSNLLQLVTKANLEGFYYKPRVDKDLLAQYRQGLVILSGCPNAEIPRLILEGRLEEAKATAHWYRETFEDFYLEIQRHGNLPELETINSALLELHQETGIPLVATNDSHYVDQKDAPLQDILICIHTNTTIHDDKRLKMSDDSLYLKSPQEMEELFADLPETLENTQRIADMCHVELDFSTLHLPQYPIPEEEAADDYLARLCWEGLHQRFQQITPELEQRLQYELEVIRRTQFPNYFLVVWDIASFARQQNILFGVRGSAAASLALYCLSVTDINPLEYRLVFERFLNVERKEMPDIDMDFQDDRRDEVIRYLTQKYGADHVAQIITFGTLGAKAAIRDVGRALGLPYADADRVARLIPFRLHITLEEAIRDTPALQQMYQEDETLRHLIDTAKMLEGVVRHASTHAAGVVMSQEPLTQYVPLQRPVKGDDQDMAMTQFAMEPIAKLGLLKMDILGLINLTILSQARDLVAQHRNIQVDLHQIPLDDPKTLELLSSGETTGLFQLESPGMRRNIKELKPSSLGDVAAMIALYRPGPMEQIETFIRAKHGLQAVHYPHPALKEVLEETYGVIVYQDQVLLILQAFAGYSLGEADIVRKAMGKKIPSLMRQERERFVAGAMKGGYASDLATTVFDLMEPFAGYAFNKAHSVSYAIIAYWTAYFKANYPVEYMTAVLNCYKGNLEKVGSIVEECRRLKIPILPPNINRSDLECIIDRTPEGTPVICLGLAAVKNVGATATRPIIEARREGGPFSSVGELCRRVELRGLNRRTLESLIKVGALDVLGKRGALLACADRILALANKEAHLRQSGQTTMFDLFGQSVPTPLGSVDLGQEQEEVSTREKLAWEKELLGAYLSENPISSMAYRTDIHAIVTRDQIDSEMRNQRVNVVGQIASVRNLMSRDGRNFAIASLELLGGSVDILIWTDVLKQTERLWQEGNFVLVTGKVRVRGDELSIACDEAKEYKEASPGEEGKPQETTAPDAYPLHSEERDSSPEAGLPASVASTGTNGTELHGEAERDYNAPPPSTSRPETAGNGRQAGTENTRRKMLINLTETDRPQEDYYLLREAMQLLLEFRGTDTVNLFIFSNGHRVRLELPLISTRYCPELHQRLAELLGHNEAIRLESEGP